MSLSVPAYVCPRLSHSPIYPCFYLMSLSIYLRVSYDVCYTCLLCPRVQYVWVYFSSVCLQLFSRTILDISFYICLSVYIYISMHVSANRNINMKTYLKTFLEGFSFVAARLRRNKTETTYIPCHLKKHGRPLHEGLAPCNLYAGYKDFVSFVSRHLYKHGRPLHGRLASCNLYTGCKDAVSIAS